jgi:hypothetical protein
MMSGVLILPITIVQCLTGIATGFIIRHTGISPIIIEK